jgi:hypothetical protein
MSVFSRLFGKKQHKEQSGEADAVSPDPKQTISRIEDTAAMHIRVPADGLPALIDAAPEIQNPDPPSRKHRIEKEGFRIAMTNPAVAPKIGIMGGAAVSAILEGPKDYHAWKEPRKIAKELNGIEKTAAGRDLTPQEGSDIVTLTTKLGAGARPQDIRAAAAALVQIDDIDLASRTYLAGQIETLRGQEREALATLNKGRNENDRILPGDDDYSQALDRIKAPATLPAGIRPFPLSHSSPARDALMSAAHLAAEAMLPQRRTFNTPQSPNAADNPLEMPSFKKPDKGLVKELDKWDEYTRGATPGKRETLENDLLARAASDWKHLGHASKELVIEVALKQRLAQAENDSHELGKIAGQLVGHESVYLPENTPEVPPQGTLAQRVEMLQEAARPDGVPHQPRVYAYSDNGMGPLLEKPIKPMETPAMPESGKRQLN